MYIYKITNKINNKIYIGQTTRTIQQRWIEHQYFALNQNGDTYFCRALRKYGVENFEIEKIDETSSQEELNKKEKHWIKYYNSCEEGYNSTTGGEAGNTYINKTVEELEKIKTKIRQSKIGGNNPQSKKVKCRNELTGEEYHFDSLSMMKEFFGATNHNFITKRCLGEIKCLYKNKWNIAYEQNDYNILTTNKNNRKSKKIVVEILDTKEVNIFESYASAERYFNLPLKTFSNKAYLQKDKKSFIVKNKYKISILN